MKKIFKFFVFVFIIGFLGFVISNNYPFESTEVVLSVNEEAVDEEGFKLKYVDCYEFTEYSEFNCPKDGYVFYCLVVEVENNTNVERYVGRSDFVCYADDIAMEEHYFTDDNNFNSATLSPGTKTGGRVYFEVPRDAEVIKVEFEKEFWSNDKVILVVR